MPGEWRGHCQFKDMSSCHDVMFHVVMYLDIFSVSVSYLHLHLPFKCTIFLQNIQFFIIVFSQGFCKRECLKHLQFLIICWNSSVLNVHSDHSMFVRNCFYCSIQNLQCWVYLHSKFNGNLQFTRSERWNECKDISIYIFRFIYYFYNIEYLCIF